MDSKERKIAIEEINLAREEALSLKGHESVGKGMTAEVFFGEKYPNYCYKIITNNTEYGKGNNVETESDIHDKLTGVQFEGARVPRPIYFKMDDGEDLMVMERVHGLTVDEIIKTPSVLPKDFDIDKFSRALMGFLRLMHDKNIHHRDLHSGNVMIDLRTGDPRIIDFGKAVIQPGEEKDIYTDRIKGVSYTPDDVAAKSMVGRLKASLNHYRNSGPIDRKNPPQESK